jgi:hypothetical protein
MTGMISSPNKAISRCWFKELRNGEFLEITGAVKVTDLSALVELKKPTRGTRFAILGKSHGLDRFCMTGEGLTDSPFYGGVLRGLIKLGAITQADLDEHREWDARRSADANRGRTLAALDRICAELNIPVPDVPQIQEARCRISRQEVI